ncbi:MAG TPA: class I SAM-dependent methyltransferase, partial [Micromonosporaceae bacterium]
MTDRMPDGSGGDTDYTRIGNVYTGFRNPDPRIAAVLATALGTAGTVLNVGAGAGSYEPADRDVTAVEPSASMRARRPAGHPAIDAMAERLPFADNAFEATMATFTVHQWKDLRAGLAEMRRVTSGAVAILTCDPLRLHRFWLREYAPEVLDTEARRYPAIAAIAEGLGQPVEALPVAIPIDCTDGFTE